MEKESDEISSDLYRVSASDDDGNELEDSDIARIPYATPQAYMKAKQIECTAAVEVPEEPLAEKPPIQVKSEAMKPTGQPTSKPPFYEKAYMEYFEKEKRLVKDIEDALEKEKKEYPFTPETGKKTSPRTFQKFMEEQRNFVKEKLANIEVLRKVQAMSNMARCQQAPKLEDVPFAK